MSSYTDQKMWRLAGQYSALGIEMAVAVSVGTLGGSWLDEKLGTEPYLLVLGLVVGVGAAAKAVLRVVRVFQDKSKVRDDIQQ